MYHRAPEWLHSAQTVMQHVACCLVGGLALLLTGWTIAAGIGWAPWLELKAALYGEPVAGAGMVFQLALTSLLLGLCFFLPTNARVLQLETSHRNFTVSMWDVARAYQAAHAADRGGVFTLKSEFDSVRERLAFLREHPDLGRLEPEILEVAAQMSHVSRELAEIYSDERVNRARHFLEQRQQEATELQERIRTAHAICHELKRWLDRVEVEEAVARSQLARLHEGLTELLPALGLEVTDKARVHIEPFGIRGVVGE